MKSPEGSATASISRTSTGDSREDRSRKYDAFRKRFIGNPPGSMVTPLHQRVDLVKITARGMVT
jgi:hypothetical protein